MVDSDALIFCWCCWRTGGWGGSCSCWRIWKKKKGNNTPSLATLSLAPDKSQIRMILRRMPTEHVSSENGPFLYCLSHKTCKVLLIHAVISRKRHRCRRSTKLAIQGKSKQGVGTRTASLTLRFGRWTSVTCGFHDMSFPCIFNETSRGVALQISYEVYQRTGLFLLYYPYLFCCIILHAMVEINIIDKFFMSSSSSFLLVYLLLSWNSLSIARSIECKNNLDIFIHSWLCPWESKEESSYSAPLQN